MMNFFCLSNSKVSTNIIYENQKRQFLNKETEPLLYLVILLFCFNFRISRRIYHLDQCPQNRSFTHRVVFPLRTVIIK